VELGRLNGVGLGFTDGAPLPAGAGDEGGGFLFTAVAEASGDHIADGECVASAIGKIDARGRLVALRELEGAPKVEGIDLRARGSVLDLCLVTDADDPKQAAQLLTARVTG
jgi:hypothetical protein